MFKSTLKNPWFWITVAILAFSLWKSCNNGPVGFLGCNNDTLKHTIDTTIKETKDTSDISYKPTLTPDTVILTRWRNPKEVHDTLEIADDRPVTDTLSEIMRLQVIERAYNKKNIYLDTIKDKNWIAVVKDTVQKNKLTGVELNVIVTKKDTLIKESTTILKHKIILYFGVTGFGSRSDIFHGGIADLSLKGRNDMMYSVGVGKIRGDKELYYSAGVKFPIRLFNFKK